MIRNKVRACLKHLHSPDVTNLEIFEPEVPDNFSLLIQAFVGPEGNEGEESFDIIVCTPKWILDNYDSDSILVGRHHLIVQSYDYLRIKSEIEGHIDSSIGESWDEVALKISRLGKWEFEDYID